MVLTLLRAEGGCIFARSASVVRWQPTYLEPRLWDGTKGCRLDTTLRKETLCSVEERENSADEATNGEEKY